MARATGDPDTDLGALKHSLRTQIDGYEFFQVIRLLRLLSRETIDRSDMSIWDKIRVRPSLGLAFPPTDLQGLAWEEVGEKPVLDVNFFGLYGVSSPLPTFYTEDLIESHQNENDAPRDFLDIFHGVLYPLLFDVWEKVRLSVRAYEKGEDLPLNLLHVFTGLSDPVFRKNEPLTASALKYAGLLTQHPRSARGLEQILSDVLGQVPVSIEQCPEKSVAIPREQRLLLGNELPLGLETVLGETIPDRANQVRIVVGPVDNDAFDRLLPGNDDFGKVVFWFGFYLLDPVQGDMEIILEDAFPRPVCLGESSRSRLGLDAWLEAGSYSPKKRVRFSLQSQYTGGPS
ncbi:MAG: type VI secretion system baseplate subunit TssG [Nitrospirota bacterium]|nr:type VI secretion system baseplate subunit TssG [Nitrospirota bacterium]